MILITTILFEINVKPSKNVVSTISLHIKPTVRKSLHTSVCIHRDAKLIPLKWPFPLCHRHFYIGLSLLSLIRGRRQRRVEGGVANPLLMVSRWGQVLPTTWSCWRYSLCWPAKFTVRMMEMCSSQIPWRRGPGLRWVRGPFGLDPLSRVRDWIFSSWTLKILRFRWVLTSRLACESFPLFSWYESVGVSLLCAHFYAKL